jgi:hypothetical protein
VVQANLPKATESVPVCASSRQLDRISAEIAMHAIAYSRRQRFASCGISNAVALRHLQVGRILLFIDRDIGKQLRHIVESNYLPALLTDLFGC